MGVRTGKEYIEGLRDGRQLYVNGELIQDVTQYPPFQGVIREMASSTTASMSESIRTC